LQAGIDVTMAESIKQYPNIEGGLIKDAAVVASGTRVNAWIGVLPPEDRPVGLRSKNIAEQLRLNVGDIQDAEEINFDFTFNDEQSGVRFALNHQDLDRLRE
ncbi:MAG TPA: hypothetical protein DHU81_04660, partial [Hyphomonas sp.]|nr:hypothetical protein [Hyphomonas sp.]